MDTQKAFIVIGITVTAVILFNVVLFVWAKGRGTKPGGEVDMLKKAFTRAKNPWGNEDEKLAELSATVAALQNHKNADDPQEEG